MRVKTSITISQDVLQDIARFVGPRGSRSRLIEAAVTEYLDSQRRADRDARDLDLINRNADRLNRLVAESLEDQVDL